MSKSIENRQGWYCAHCQHGVDPSEVTYHETHKKCGRYITDDEPPIAINYKAHAEALFEALKHLHHNAYKSGADMGLALDVAEDAINKFKAAQS